MPKNRIEFIKNAHLSTSLILLCFFPSIQISFILSRKLNQKKQEKKYHTYVCMYMIEIDANCVPGVPLLIEFNSQ